MIITRENSMGLRFQISPIGDDQCNITLIGTNKSLTVSASLDAINQGWYYWMNGKFVQDAFPMLSSEQREFLMTGITPSEWNEIFDREEE